MKTCTCFSCGGEFPETEGPVHPYMKSSPGCWATFGEVLAREYSDPAYFSVHRLTVDSYAVQHPGSKDRKSIQSVAFHLIRLCMFLEHNLVAEKANDLLLEVGKYKHTFTWLLLLLWARSPVRMWRKRPQRTCIRNWFWNGLKARGKPGLCITTPSEVGCLSNKEVVTIPETSPPVL